MTRSTFTAFAVPLVLAALAITVLWPARAHAQTVPVAATSYGAIATRALLDNDQKKGECFPWVREVVKAATGRTIGGDYHTGYLAAGAIEVPLVSARNGDIIQITNPAITGAFVDYPGLHTAIVLDNLGNGEFRVIDSNKDFDGVVHVRNPYVPSERVARYPGLVVRVYRIEGTTAPVGTPPPPPITSTPLPQPIGPTGTVPAAGTSATISADGDCLRVRSSAGLGGSVMGCLPSGSRVTVTANGPATDGFRWVQVSSGSLTGWVAADYLSTSAPAPSIAAPIAAPPVIAPPIAIAPPIVAAPPKGVFAAKPVFGAESGQASVVFIGGTVDQLIGAATESGASGVWAQDIRGEFQLLIINGPSFMTEQFRIRLSGFSGPTALTLIGTR